MALLDFTISDAFNLMERLGEFAEHEGYIEELERMNLSDRIQAADAVRRWIRPVFERSWANTPAAMQRTRASFLVVLSRWGFLPHGPYLPGIDPNSSSYTEPQSILAGRRRFYEVVWSELFDQTLVRLQATNALMERNDASFVNSPNRPDLWREPRYRSIQYWDGLLREVPWKNDWAVQ